MNFRIQKKISLVGLFSTTTIYILGLFFMLNALEHFIEAFSMTYNSSNTLLQNFESFCSNDNAVMYLALGFISTLGLIKLGKAMLMLCMHILSARCTPGFVHQSAYTFGLFKPSVYIDRKISNNLNAKEYQAIQLHEEYHQKSYDPLVLLLVNFTSNILPTFPGKSRLYNTIFLLMELAADEYVFEQMQSKRPLLSSLMKMITLKSIPKNQLLVGFSNITDERISIHTNNSSFNFLKPLLHGIFILSFIFIIFVNAARLNSSDAFVCEVPEKCSSIETKTLTCS